MPPSSPSSFPPSLSPPVSISFPPLSSELLACCLSFFLLPPPTEILFAYKEHLSTKANELFSLSILLLSKVSVIVTNGLKISLILLFQEYQYRTFTAVYY